MGNRRSLKWIVANRKSHSTQQSACKVLHVRLNRSRTDLAGCGTDHQPAGNSAPATFVALPQKRNNMEEISMEKARAGSSHTVHLRQVACCDPCLTKVQSRRKYVFTDQIDQLIREIYLNHRGAKTRPGIRLLSKKVGMPHWALKKRARELGLARTKELPWSERELEILARYAWMSDERIRLKLKAAGYSRTVTGIHLKLKRMRFKHDGSFYSAYGLAQALGIDSHAVTRWIKSGHLKAKFAAQRETEQQNGDIYLIHEKDVRRFILEHPTDIDLRKVDQLWFLDLITNGLVRAA